MPFTEFCCRSGGSNLNAGTRLGDGTEPGTSAALTYASGSWVNGTGVFTVASGDPIADGVAVGDFASVYDNAASVTTLVGRVTARTTTTITVSTSAKTGTTADGTGNRTLRIGGAWLGPNGASGFPMNFITNACQNAAGDLPRINYKNDANYAITANISNIGANTTHQGYGAFYGDLGVAILDGGTSGAAYTLIGPTVGNNAVMADFWIKNNGATGTVASAVFFNSSGGLLLRVTVSDMRAIGIQTNGTTFFNSIEVFGCLNGGIILQGNNSRLINSIIHSNTSYGVRTAAFGNYLINSIVAKNSGIGIQADANATTIDGCDIYDNGSDGIRANIGGTQAIYVVNSNLVKNNGWGINATATKMQGLITNCGFGSGTQANTSGKINAMQSVIESGTVDYAANTSPWIDADTGDFRLAVDAAKQTGSQVFTQRASGWAGTVGYPDIGAAQALITGGGGGGAAFQLVGGGGLVY